MVHGARVRGKRLCAWMACGKALVGDLRMALRHAEIKEKPGRAP
jgi:hypothetical protein